MRDRWRGLTSSSPAAIIHALHWASGASPFSARALPFLSLREKKSKHFVFCLVKKKIHTLYYSNKHQTHLLSALINPRRATTCLSHLS